MSVPLPALWDRLDALAEDVGRLRRRLKEDEYGSHLADRIASHVEAIDCMTTLSAAEFVAIGYHVDHALAASDTHRTRTLTLLDDPRVQVERDTARALARLAAA